MRDKANSLVRLVKGPAGLAQVILALNDTQVCGRELMCKQVVYG